MELKLIFLFQCYRHVAPDGAVMITFPIITSIFLIPCSLLVLSGAEVFLIQIKNNLSPDRPLAHCSLPIAPTPALIRIFVHDLTIT